ncbi:peptide-N(4)-(N-acetyl-beta-glucosaminyl)asparagine amidase [Pieris rapae]|uniref:peptide-N(4)-(N-acetyl-beta- glucosaminyl)asparagine amidase n=1 Tax=Pieris rapae TaxID=64459 RepID=UPI001E27A49D|nr:peptide-N(4)-(N-acetyl-beta-glucosaminyl)asparagine amidase [Pieris rapae]
MEDMARLAVVEQSVKNVNKFRKILYELLQNINHILDHPNNSRHLKIEVVENIRVFKELNDYLLYVGFRWEQNKLIYPIDKTIDKLRMAKSAIERKMSLCVDSKTLSKIEKVPIKKYKLTPINVLMTTNKLLLTIQILFNRVLDYEDEELQQAARNEIPMVTLELRALKRMREIQKKIKTGDTKEEELSYDIALLMELIGWFKHKYFSWVDSPQCETCGGPTKFYHSTTLTTATETCNAEVYSCAHCGNYTKFPRYNDIRALMRTRRGRCGEWANCFAMFCRALGYDTRYIYDSTDHVWCEVYDYVSKNWLHVDPCEGALDTPLMYDHGWGKKLTYVIAVSCNDVQDVTWRYTTKHKEVLLRRNQCTEQELISTLLTLREHRLAQVSPARRKWLTTRTIHELAQMMLERKPSDYESRGRISGSKEWKTQRGEIGSQFGHGFEFDQPGEVSIQYYCSPDKYHISRNGEQLSTLDGWGSGVYKGEHIFRNVEKDWRQVYIAREEGEISGKVSWKLSVKDGLIFTSLTVRVTSAIFENGSIKWHVQFDDNNPIVTDFNETTTEFSNQFKRVIITAHLSGGQGNVSWQHSQLFRQSLDSKSPTFEVNANIKSN